MLGTVDESCVASIVVADLLAVLEGAEEESDEAEGRRGGSGVLNANAAATASPEGPCGSAHTKGFAGTSAPEI